MHAHKRASVRDGFSERNANAHVSVCCVVKERETPGSVPNSVEIKDHTQGGVCSF